MSVEAIARAWKVEGVQPSEKLLLVALAFWANDEDAAWPSSATIIEKTGMSRSTVMKGLRALKRKELIRPIGKTGWGTIVYAVLAPPKGSSIRTPRPADGLNMSDCRTSGGPTAGPNPTSEQTVKEESPPDASAPDPKPSPKVTWLTAFLEAWEKKTGGALLPGKAARLLAPLTKVHGNSVVLASFTRYLDATDIGYCSVGRFAETYRKWALTPPAELLRAKLEPVDEDYRRRHREQMAKANGTAGAA